MIIPISKNNVACLTPREWKLIEHHLNADYKIRGDFLLQTAMRISEAMYVAHHPECYRKDNGAIFLPKVEGMGKRKAKQKERAVLLSPTGRIAVELFFQKDVGLPSYQAMEGALKRAAKEADFDIRFITTKMFRKTFITWQMACYPERQGMIASSAGHTNDTMQSHYITYGFKKEDLKEMKEMIAGWGEV
jgi:integrase